MPDCTCAPGSLDYSCPAHGLKKQIEGSNRKAKAKLIRKAQKQRVKDAYWAGMKDMALHILGTKSPCGLCGKPLDNGEIIDADHIHSRARGGSNTPDNLRLVHRSCHDVHHGVPLWSGDAS